MFFSHELRSYLSGERFSSSLLMDLGVGIHKWSGTLSRLEFLLQYFKGKSILHVGCADHLPLIKMKRAKGNWLHDMLTHTGDVCLGVDINTEAIALIRSLGINNVVYGDVAQDSIKEIKERVWDVVVFGEIIEHLEDPIGYLRAMKKNIGLYVKDLVITTPNALSLANMVYLLKGKECINTDHKCWFGAYTLAKTVSVAGWVPKEIAFVRHEAKRHRV